MTEIDGRPIRRQVEQRQRNAVHVGALTGIGVGLLLAIFIFGYFFLPWVGLVSGMALGLATARFVWRADVARTGASPVFFDGDGWP